MVSLQKIDVLLSHLLKAGRNPSSQFIDIIHLFYFKSPALKYIPEMQGLQRNNSLEQCRAAVLLSAPSPARPSVLPLDTHRKHLETRRVLVLVLCGFWHNWIFGHDLVEVTEKWIIIIKGSVCSLRALPFLQQGCVLLFYCWTLRVSWVPEDFISPLLQ